MKPKHYFESKNLPKTPFLMMVATDDDKEHPFYAINVHRGTLTGVMVITGETIIDLIKQPIRILQLHSDACRGKTLYIDKVKKHPGIKYYRAFTPEDAKIWKEKLLPLLHQDLPNKNMADYEQHNAKAKKLFATLYVMMG
ncbi:MAG: hypothetical protein ACD_80C00041G0001 [uncultured bacterium (gcode 4)]|uniref:Uncharacterized protein n=1 Tax=uncultured bacterium (gcode 4) TaxID=1234023 RepID=K1XJZ7_9BACT|nr:MAG: hypothetical protein ACD_80C00041G0001 [uncultured bacterium (gcode 4)]HBB04431.1 hypothetical protein [Candidatus Gracilibacteria bacterium]